MFELCKIISFMTIVTANVEKNDFCWVKWKLGKQFSVVPDIGFRNVETSNLTGSDKY